MKKTILGALIAGAFAVGGSAHASLVFDLNGALPGGVISANALDWGPTTFLAKGGTAAVANYLTGGSAAGNEFEVLTHAKLIGYNDANTGAYTGLGGEFGEITMVARYTERVAFVTPDGSFAQFATTGAGWLEFYWSAAADSVDLTGYNFNNGTLIGRLDGVTIGAMGNFTITGGPVDLDQTTDGNQYMGQLTVEGFGTQASLQAGLTGKVLDPNFFKSTVAGFTIQYSNISIGLPYDTVNPSDCFNNTPSAAAVGTAGLTSTCDNNHVNDPDTPNSGLYSLQGGPGYVPVVGPVNGFSVAGSNAPDFVAQTDFNSRVTGVPEPTSLALVGLALAGLGLSARRRKAA